MKRTVYTYTYYPYNDKATEYSKNLGLIKSNFILLAVILGFAGYWIANYLFYLDEKLSQYIGIAVGVVSAILELWFCISMKKKIDKCLEEQKAEEQRAAVQKMKEQMLEEQRRREQMLAEEEAEYIEDEEEEYVEDEEEENNTQEESPDGENSVAKYCSFCGHKVVFGDKYCSECGRTIRYD